MSDIQARIAEVLEKHQAVHIIDGPTLCRECDWESLRIGLNGPAQHRKHQASMLAPLIREAQREAWDEGEACGIAFQARGPKESNPHAEESEQDE